MKRFWLIVLAMFLAICAAKVCMGQDGVLSEERVINLPQDQTKWHVSVVGKSDAQYQKLIGWFDVGSLKKLREQVHFHPVTTDMPIYSRYTPNKGLPMVRVQDDQGVVVYEASNDIPMTGEGLYAAIASAVNGSEELLPWRRRHNVQPQPQPQPNVDPGVDPLPVPLDNVGPPVVESEPMWPVLVIVGLFIVALMVGQVEAWKKTRK